MASHRITLAKVHGLRFFKLLGTGSGRTFTLRDSDPHHWGLLTVWPDLATADGFEEHKVLRAWRRIAAEQLRVVLEPIASRGAWAGQQPFAAAAAGSDVVLDADAPTKHGSEHGSTVDHQHVGIDVPGGEDAAATGMPTAATSAVAAITRARIKPRYWRRFGRAVPEVADDIARDPALLFSLGIGEAPVGLLGTFSIWRDGASITRFAYRRSAHTAVIEQTERLQWYSEEMFARFRVRDVTGRYDGREVSVSGT